MAHAKRRPTLPLDSTNTLGYQTPASTLIALGHIHLATNRLDVLAEEASRMTGLSPATLRQYSYRGTLKPIRNGRYAYYCRQSLASLQVARGMLEPLTPEYYRILQLKAPPSSVADMTVPCVWYELTAIGRGRQWLVTSIKDLDTIRLEPKRLTLKALPATLRQWGLLPPPGLFSCSVKVVEDEQEQFAFAVLHHAPSCQPYYVLARAGYDLPPAEDIPTLHAPSPTLLAKLHAQQAKAEADYEDWD